MIEKKLINNAKKIDKFLVSFLNNQKQSSLVKPMKYGVISGGKKIRSTIIFDTGKPRDHEIRIHRPQKRPGQLLEVWDRQKHMFCIIFCSRKIAIFNKIQVCGPSQGLGHLPIDSP